MDNSDGRKIDRKALEAIRIRAVKRVEAGESPEVVIKALGFTRTLIYTWIAKYREGGIDALRSRKAPGKSPKLGGQQLRRLYQIVVGNDPRQLKFEFALWTRAMVREFIQREFRVKMSDTAVGRLLKKLGLSPQRPTRQAIQRDELAVFKWMAEDYKEIQKLAKKHQAEIYFGDESSVRSDYHSGTTWAPRGKTPVVKTTGKRHRVNLISAINSRGIMRFMATEDNVNADVFISFLKRLIFKASSNIFLVVDNHSVHRSEEVRKYVESTEGKLRIFFLPPYAPELNPDEHVWNYLKNHKIGRQTTSGGFELYKRVESIMRSLQRLPEKLKSFFMHPWTKYASMSTDQ
ncbi:IS630 family transposase [Desulfopila sp. IMCC35006]|uniref:IS630 family transposase n=1 Tax=Desulfopila sp. IMCC35006 TaxID=2569542 RepID=UPI0010AD1183|nr:IS630 family transposase [Desulfopila sp. IMCC35006]TKB23953.1 IS630 family transposase [Desulfopila sp. IMCC35006]